MNISLSFSSSNISSWESLVFSFYQSDKDFTYGRGHILATNWAIKVGVAWDKNKNDP